MTDQLPNPDPSGDAQEPSSPYSTYLRLALIPWATHFKSPSYLEESTMQMLDTKVTKTTLQRTVKDPAVRQALGTDRTVWLDLNALFEAAVPSLESRSFAASDPNAPEYEAASGPLIAANHKSLQKDLERLNDVVSIMRNCLSIGKEAQDMAAECGFHKELFDLIAICVKVTARGYDGDAGTEDEDKWQLVVNSYKKLLITCLQFLNNFVSQNEIRKLMLWVDLFDCGEGSVQALSSMPKRPELWPNLDAFPRIRVEWNEGNVGGPSLFPHTSPMTDEQWENPPASFLLYFSQFREDITKELFSKNKDVKAGDLADESKRRWLMLPEEEKAKWHAYAEEVEKYRRDTEETESREEVAKQNAELRELRRSIDNLKFETGKIEAAMELGQVSTGDAVTDGPFKNGMPSPSVAEILLSIPNKGEIVEPSPAVEADYKMAYTAGYGTKILQNGKDDLMKRLETDTDRQAVVSSQVISPASPVMSPTSPPPPPPVAELEIRVAPADALLDDLSEEEGSEDDDYVVPGDDGRGLLTDVPLILGPTEIEVLPMIIMSGVVPPTSPRQPGYGSTPEEVNSIKNYHTVRCHILLAQDNGRNLLRELLIFVAAWDLREEELYFKFMVKIMEAILMNGLMPFSYHAFRESKDIISPAQAVIMKLLTNIFRARQASISPLSLSKETESRDQSTSQRLTYPLKVDVHMVNFLFTEFRRHIIPQTCALIFLQGQICIGRAMPEDFPLNLWDMERMYEGVYQYLEFFAILTEHDVWKSMMAEWEITSELVTLLKELDAAIPKAGPIHAHRRNAQHQQQQAYAAQAAPVSVERPYDVNAPALPPTDPYLPSPTDPYTQLAHDEPSDFEWRNLKKLCILVLSSLIWKSRQVQDQIRIHGGIEAILNCCNHDEHNPYIKEHAIMCLRFLMEGNKENQAVIRSLEGRKSVPSEVLDQHGYETFMDNRGQVGLRRKENIKLHSATAGKHAPATQLPIPGSLDKLAPWMQHFMKENPGRPGQGTQQGTRGEAEKAAAAKLDRGFEGKG
ncbi:hypothetical protein M501DRAFT_937685 [Patellaria atrata CBS 101060]|uniref:Ataxin-10 homolog n=1 Tax=Patellaria atrata CBS 101060 TaxID=1346257 RepID=A0A9P4S9L9_9PEZI|nr:hypothetical protein M501DRAFT_937685 [Patellaria atrata CBS 101060]